MTQSNRPLITNPAVIVPAYNEEVAVGAVVNEVLNHCDYPIYVIDDASTDSTRASASAAGAQVIPLVANLGAWGATQTGIRYALRQGHDAVITLDADNQHNPSDISAVLEPLLEGRVDVAIGSYPVRGSLARQVAWTLLRNASGISVDDLTSGFRAYGTEAMKVLSSRSATYLDYQDIGVLSLVLREGLRVEDVPVTMNVRMDGHSRVFSSWRKVFWYMCQTLLLGLTKRQLRKKREPSLSGGTIRR